MAHRIDNAMEIMKEITIGGPSHWIEEGPLTHPNTILDNRLLDRSIVAWYAARLCLITKDKEVYRKLLHDYTRLAHLFLSITDGIKFGAKSPLQNYQNKVVAETYGFDTVEGLMKDCMKRINEENLNNFKITNLRKFHDKLILFRSFKLNKEEALESLISQKFGLRNRRKNTHRV